MLSIPIPGRQRVWGEQGGLEDKLEVSDGVVNARAKHTPLRHAGVYAPTVGHRKEFCNRKPEDAEVAKAVKKTEKRRKEREEEGERETAKGSCEGGSVI